MPDSAPAQRLRVAIRGAVQGVGFRPFVYRLASDLQLRGFVLNSSSGVLVEVEGPPDRLDEFLRRLEVERPPRAVVQGVETAFLDPAGHAGFEIRRSVDGDKTALVLPDIATCPECLAELFDPADRRHRYPFTNCTNCGPRFTIVLSLPYDRPRTTMGRFEMCPACREEYLNPRNRRFHAQPNACPSCGPQVELWSRSGARLARGEEAIRSAEAAIGRGETLALKGLGGFHLVVDAGNDEAVRRLRAAKSREEKPFALMFPTLDAVRGACVVSEREARLLVAPEAPIVLLDRVPGHQGVAASVAPGNPTLGVMLPYTPLHHVLLSDLGHAVVATSGNLADEPICTDERDAVRRLGGLADVFLVHDRPIARHADDSVARVVLGRELIVRRARGYAPLPVRVSSGGPSVLGVGPHLKNTIALSVGPNVFVSQHLGDLETDEAYRAFERTIESFRALYEASVEVVACDAHPDYLSTGYARRAGRPVAEVQHHVAHVLACMAENEIDPPVLAVAWDGTGYGPDGTVWGGESFVVEAGGVRRAATFRGFPLPGGDRAVREPRRSALGLLHEAVGAGRLAHVLPPGAFEAREAALLVQMIESGLNSPRTTSVGRLFDAVASLVGLRHTVRYEGQAAMELEFAARSEETVGLPDYPVELRRVRWQDADRSGDDLRWTRPDLEIDWQPLVDGLRRDLGSGSRASLTALRFHRWLVECIVEVARQIGLARVVLSGGCFQNRLLTELSVRRLRDEGFRPYWHQRIPPNDGGIALGQVVAVLGGFVRAAASREPKAQSREP